MPDASPNYLDPKVLEKIRRLELRARLVVDGFITGLHKSPYHGYAVEFAGHREYVPGDETRHIDWKVWGRQDRLYIKQYEEETNLQCTIVLDASKSMAYGEGAPASGHLRAGWSKFAHAATTAASLAYLLQQQQDAVGLVTFDTRIRTSISPSTHGSHLKVLLRQLEETQPDGATDVEDVFHLLAESIAKRSLVVLVSDLFADVGTLAASLKHFRHRRHEVIVMHVLHEDELTFPFTGPTMFRGLESERELLVEPTALKRTYLEVLEKYLAKVRHLCAASGVDYVLLNTRQPLDAALSAYLVFRGRVARSHRMPGSGGKRP